MFIGKVSRSDVFPHRYGSTHPEIYTRIYIRIMNDGLMNHEWIETSRFHQKHKLLWWFYIYIYMIIHATIKNCLYVWLLPMTLVPRLGIMYRH